MAIPPPHAFINVRSARCLGSDRIELAFDHPQALPGRSPLFAELFWDGPPPEPAVGNLVLGLFERREHHGEPTCGGPAISQSLEIDLPRLLPDPILRRGRIAFNDPRLYGHHRRLERFELDFDLDGAGRLSKVDGALDTPDALTLDPAAAQLAMTELERLLAWLLPSGENETWGWLPLSRPIRPARWAPLQDDSVIRLDAGGLKSNRMLGAIDVDVAAGVVFLHRYSYYGDDHRSSLRPSVEWWREARRLVWPQG